jgi:hypothetical protein
VTVLPALAVLPALPGLAALPALLVLVLLPQDICTSLNYTCCGSDDFGLMPLTLRV